MKKKLAYLAFIIFFGINKIFSYVFSYQTNLNDQNLTLYKQYNFFTDISNYSDKSFISLYTDNNSINFNNYDLNNKYLPGLSFLIHNEYSDIFFSYQFKNEEILNDDITNKNSLHMINFTLVGGNPDYRIGGDLKITYGSGDYSNSASNENYKRNIIGGIELGFGIKISTSPNFSFDLSFIEKAYGDSIKKENSAGQLITDGSVYLNVIPDINLGITYNNEKVKELFFFKWGQIHRIANSNFYNTSNGGYLKRKFGMPKYYNSHINFGNQGLLDIKKLFNKNNFPIKTSYLFEYYNSKTELYEPTSDNNFPTQQGKIKKDFDINSKELTFGIGSGYFHNFFNLTMNYNISNVKLNFGEAYKDKSSFENNIISKPGDADGYKLPDNPEFSEGFNDINDNEFYFSTILNIHLTQVIKQLNDNISPDIIIGFSSSKVYKTTHFFNNDFLTFSRPIDFENKELDLGLPYNTINKDLNYIPIGQYLQDEKYFISPLHFSSFFVGTQVNFSEQVGATIYYAINSFTINENKFNGYNVNFKFNYYF